MATPTGYIDAAAGGWPVDETGTSIPAVLALFLEPSHWTVVVGNYGFETWAQIAVDDGDALIQRWWGGGGLGAEEEETAAGGLDGVWREHAVASPLFPSGAEIDLGFAAVATPQQSGIRLGAYCDSETDAEIMALYFEAFPPYAFTDPEPTIANNLEPIANNTDANSWRPYDSQRPASAWLFRAVSDSLNKMTYETMQAWSVPL